MTKIKALYGILMLFSQKYKILKIKSQKKSRFLHVGEQNSRYTIKFERTSSDILRKDEHYKNKQVFQQIQNWLDQCFVPAIEDIEKYVLENIQEEFNQLFQRCFNILMEIGDISLEVAIFLCC
jgi:hypothetical protein